MKRILFALLLLALLPLSAQGADQPRVKLETSLGDIVLELYPDKAPETVNNFLTYVKEGYYDGTIFHRVIDNFMIQGGGHTPDMGRKATHEPIKNEAANGLHNTTGTIAMARTPDPDSATAQFFINVKDNNNLDFRSKTPQGWGYAVFGRVVEGMEVVNAIKGVPTTTRSGQQNVPVDPVIINKATLVTP